MMQNKLFEYITKSFKDIIEKHNLKVEKNDKLILFNRSFKLKFIYQNLDGIDLTFENEDITIELDLLFNKYTTGSVSLLSDEEKSSSSSFFCLIDNYSCLLKKEGYFLLENNKAEIEKFINWKNKNKQKIFDDLISSLK